MTVGITLGEFEPDGDVYVSPRRRSKQTVFHVYEDCNQAGSTVRPKDPAALFNDRTLCEYCAERLHNEKEKEESHGLRH